MYYRSLVTLALAGIISACTMNITDPKEVISNNNTNDQTGDDDQTGGGDVVVLQAPVISPAALNAGNSSTIAITLELPKNSPSNAEVYYTTDGTDPASSTSATLYMGSIKLSGTDQIYTVRAVAWDGSAFSSETTSNYKFGDWEILGDNYVMTPKSRYLAAENGVLYVAKAGAVPGSFDILSPVANVWTTVATATDCGSGWFGGNFVSPLTVENGVIYIACNMGNPGVKIQKYQSGSWTTVGGANVPIEDPVDVTLKVKNGTVYLAGVDHGNWKVRAYMFNGSAWQAMGPQPLTPDSLTRIGFDVNENNVAYISFKDSTGLNVKRYEATTDTWTNLNSGILDMGNPYSGDLRVYDDGSSEGIPYVLYRDVLGNTRIIRYSGGIWSHITSITSSDPSASIDVYLGIPYITTEDAFGKVQIKRYYNGTWEDVGSATFYDPSFPQMEIDQSNGNIYMYYTASDGFTSYGFVELFGIGGSGVDAHSSGDPLGLMF